MMKVNLDFIQNIIIEFQSLQKGVVCCVLCVCVCVYWRGCFENSPWVFTLGAYGLPRVWGQMLCPVWDI